MEYNDEKLMSMEGYATMAKAYSQSLKDRGFIFIQFDGNENEVLINEVATLFCKIKSSLLYLSGFLDTGRLYELTQRQINAFLSLYPSISDLPTYPISGDKTRCFLNMLSLESLLISKLITLGDQSPFSNQISKLVHQRLYLTSEIYKIKGLIS